MLLRGVVKMFVCFFFFFSLHFRIYVYICVNDVPCLYLLIPLHPRVESIISSAGNLLRRCVFSSRNKTVDVLRSKFGADAAVCIVASRSGQGGEGDIYLRFSTSIEYSFNKLHSALPCPSSAIPLDMLSNDRMIDSVYTRHRLV